MTAVNPEQTGVKLMNQLLGGAGQVAAVFEQLLPKPAGSGLERHWAKGVADLPEQDG